MGEHEHWLRRFSRQGHEPEANEDGVMDIFAFSEGETHNGPRCRKCGWGECWHCDRTGAHIPVCAAPPDTEGGAS